MEPPHNILSKTTSTDEHREQRRNIESCKTEKNKQHIKVNPSKPQQIS
jgi:hypothetical protein